MCFEIPVFKKETASLIFTLAVLLLLFSCPSPDWRTAHTHCPCVSGWSCVGGWCVKGDVQACTPKTCSDLGMECGTGDDGCGGTVDCGTCRAHQACQSGKCIVQPWCGDGKCLEDTGENCLSCPDDCGCGQDQVCYKNACCTPKTCSGLGWECGTGDDGCGGKVDCGKCDSAKVCDSSHKCIATWKDPTTGYEWQVNPLNNNGNGLQWQAAMDFCKSLGENWHLPTISELRTLIRGCAGTVTSGACKVTDNCLKDSCWDNSCGGCDELKGPGPGGVYGPGELNWPDNGDWYWSSSSVAGNPSSAWLVFFFNGYVYYYHKFNHSDARCVRLGH